MNNETQELWFVTGSQHLYGPKTLEQVASDSKQIAAALNAIYRVRYLVSDAEYNAEAKVTLTRGETEASAEIDVDECVERAALRSSEVACFSTRRPALARVSPSSTSRSAMCAYRAWTFAAIRVSIAAHSTS